MKAILSVNQYVEFKINSTDRDNFLKNFDEQAKKLTADEFLFYWIDVIAMEFQYSNGKQFC
jgi:hypothetical protein